jgi:hypothetical protein
VTHPAKRARQDALAWLLGWRPEPEAEPQPRDERGRFTKPICPDWDAGARGHAVPRRDPLAEHAATLVGLIRARRYGLRDPEW